MSETVNVDTLVDCCKNNSTVSNSLCFVNADRNTSYCLKVRAAVEASTFCNATTPSSCPLASVCLTPELKNPAKLLQIKRRDDKDFLFVGNAAEVYYYSQVQQKPFQFNELEKEGESQEGY